MYIFLCGQERMERALRISTLKEVVLKLFKYRQNLVGYLLDIANGRYRFHCNNMARKSELFLKSMFNSKRVNFKV